MKKEEEEELLVVVVLVEVEASAKVVCGWNQPGRSALLLACLPVSSLCVCVGMCVFKWAGRVLYVVREERAAKRERNEDDDEDHHP